MEVNKLNLSNNDLNSLLNGEVETESQAADLKLPSGEENKNDKEESSKEETKDKDKQEDSSKENPDPDKKEQDKQNQDKEKQEDKEKDKQQDSETQDDDNNENHEVLLDFSNKLQDNLGIELDDEDLKNIDLEDGYGSAIAIASIASDKKAAKLLDTFFEEYPDVYEYALHRKAGGNKETFFDNEQIPDLTNVSVSKEDAQSQEYWYRTYLKLKGTETEEIDDLVTLAKDKGQLFEKGTQGFEKVKDHSEKLKVEKFNADQQRIQEEDNKRLETLKDIKKTLDTGKILNTDISREDAKEFLNYFIKPIDKGGKTLRDKVDEELSLQEELLLEYIKFKKFKGFIPEKEQKKVVKSLFDMKKQNEGRTSKTAGQREETPKDGSAPKKLDFTQDQLKNLLQQ